MEPISFLSQGCQKLSRKDRIKMERKSIGGLTDSALEMLGYDKEKILKAVENCVIAMGELTIAESKVARKHLDSVMEEMYKRSPDTLISAIQPRL